MWFNELQKIKKSDKATESESCDQCQHQHTMQCPNSNECYSTQNKPYFKQKEEE